MGAKVFSIWGKFTKKRLERKYIIYSNNEVLERNRVGIFIAGITFFIIGISDFFRIDFGIGLYSTIGLRVCVIAYSLYIFFSWKQFKKIPIIYTHVVLYSLLFICSLIIIVYQLNPQKNVQVIDLFTVPVTILLMYVFIILPSHYMGIIGVTTSWIYVCLLRCHFNNIDGEFMYVYGIIVLVINALGFYITRFLSVTRRQEFLRVLEIEALNAGLKDEIEERQIIQDKLEFTYTELTDSLKYANHLQLAMLSDPTVLNEYFQEFFVLYKPCEIVSGDFYWFATQNSKIVLAAADCTGHGIRAAFMSIVGIAFLNDIVNNKNILEPHEILNRLKEQIIKNLRQSGAQQTAHDGMDIALCVFDRETYELQYAGAYNPLILIRDNTVLEYKADRMPISYYFAAKPSFTNNKIQLQKNDSFYLFTDGFADQFGGQKNKKYTHRRLKQELLLNSNQSMESQRDLLLNTHIAWKGHEPQTDDIVFLGLKV